MGSAQPRPCPRERRGAAPHELAGRVGGDTRRARHRPLLVGEGLRYRVEPAVVATAHGGARRGRVPQARLAGFGVALTPRGDVPRHVDPDLRWRHERVPARPHLAVHARAAAGESLMDFAFTSDQDDLRELAAKILGDAADHERVRRVLATDLAVDRDLWVTMAEAGLVGISLPEAVGGGGCGFLETCIVLEEVGRAAAPVPALAVMGLGAAALARFGALAHLDGVSDGSRVVTAALIEPLGDVFAPSTVASADGRLTGEKVC